MIRSYIVPLLAALAICYPLYATLLLIADSLTGTQQLIGWWLFESKHALLLSILGDVAASLVWVVPAVLIGAFIALRIWQARTITARGRILTLSLLLIAPATGLYAIGFAAMQAVLLGCSLWFAVIAALMTARICRHALPH